MPIIMRKNLVFMSLFALAVNEQFHYKNYFQIIADRGYIIVHGQIEFEGENANALRNNEMVRQYYLGV